MAGDETDPDEDRKEKRKGRVPLFLAIAVGWVLLVILLVGVFSGSDDDAVDVKTRLDQNGALGSEEEEEEELAGGVAGSGSDDGSGEPGTGSSSAGEASVTEGRVAGGSGSTTTTAKGTTATSPSGGSPTTAAPLPSGGGTSGGTSGGGGGTTGSTAPPITTTTTEPGATTTSPPPTSSTIPPTTTTTTPGTPPPSSATITIRDGNTYDVSEVTIAAGGTVTMRNTDNTGSNPNHSWRFSESVNYDLRKDASQTLSFPQAGEYSFSCRFHSSMTGKVIVV